MWIHWIIFSEVIGELIALFRLYHCIISVKSLPYFSKLIDKNLFSGISNQLSQISSKSKKTVSDISQIPIFANSSVFEIFQLNISEDSLYDEDSNDQVSGFKF